MLVAQVMLQDGKIQALTPTLRAKATEIVNSMSEKALRCLAFAQKTDDLGTMLLCTSYCNTLQTVLVSEQCDQVAPFTSSQTFCMLSS